ncbi:hypothetical protein BLS_003156 [Venturia inaequalis]|uniref:RING-type domain-containing protein n=1 Tax=Venturia inaequalis TaxID=5025 RepID=A0A8H3UPF6_VENIN|nr:hypothetical protein BLS_003156 [Venturia inaequalis]
MNSLFAPNMEAPRLLQISRYGSGYPLFSDSEDDGSNGPPAKRRKRPPVVKGAVKSRSGSIAAKSKNISRPKQKKALPRYQRCTKCEGRGKIGTTHSVKDHTVKRGDTEIQRRGYEKTSWKKCRSCKGIGKTRQAVQKSSRKPVKAPEVRSRFETPGDESDGGEFFNAPEIHNEEFFNTPEIHNEEFFNTPEIHSSTPLLQAPKEAKSPARRDCSTCAEEKPIAEYGYKLTRTCIHARGTCQDCVVQWVEAKIEEGEWNTITCPECDSLLEYTDISQILSSTSASFQHYDDLATKACLNSMGEYRHCLSPTCKAGQLHSGGADSPIFVCRSCGHKSCTIHDVPWHEGEICTDYDTRTAHAKQGAADNAASEAEVAKMKACVGLSFAMFVWATTL